jgi:hypothetical protein
MQDKSRMERVNDPFPKAREYPLCYFSGSREIMTRLLLDPGRDVKRLHGRCRCYSACRRTRLPGGTPASFSAPGNSRASAFRSVPAGPHTSRRSRARRSCWSSLVGGQEALRVARLNADSLLLDRPAHRCMPVDTDRWASLPLPPTDSPRRHLRPRLKPTSGATGGGKPFGL